VYITLMRAFFTIEAASPRLAVSLPSPLLDLPAVGFRDGASGGDSLVVSLGVRETRLELEVLKVSGDESAWVFPKKPSILVGCGVE